MPSVTIRNLPEEVHRALRLQAAHHGRSTEAEIRNILQAAVKPEQRLRVGDALAAWGKGVGVTEGGLAIPRPRRPAKPVRFE